MERVLKHKKLQSAIAKEVQMVQQAQRALAMKIKAIEEQEKLQVGVANTYSSNLCVKIYFIIK